MELTKKLILSRINGNNGRTLIPFVGSGSECVVAKTLGIEYLGIELNSEYVEYANKWLKLID
jgi:site-specific DNA-methyltransferase (adenine-specific)